MKLATLGVAAEVIVVVEDQNPTIITQRLAIEVGCGKAGDSGTDHHQIVMLAGILGSDPAVEFAIACEVRDLKRSGVLAAQTAAQRRVGVGLRRGNWRGRR